MVAVAMTDRDEALHYLLNKLKSEDGWSSANLTWNDEKLAVISDQFSSFDGVVKAKVLLSFLSMSPRTITQVCGTHTCIHICMYMYIVHCTCTSHSHFYMYMYAQCSVEMQQILRLARRDGDEWVRLFATILAPFPHSQTTDVEPCMEGNMEGVQAEVEEACESFSLFLLPSLSVSLSPLSLSQDHPSPLSRAIIPLSSLSRDHPSLLSLSRDHPSIPPTCLSTLLSFSLSIPLSLLPSLPPSPTHPYFPSPFPFSSVSHKTDSSFTPHEFACLNHSVLSAAHNYSPPTGHTHFKLRQQPQASVQLRNDMLQKGGTGFI